MKTALTLAITFAITASASNLRWTTDFTSGYRDVGGSLGDGLPFAKLTYELLDGATVGQLTAEVYAPFNNLEGDLLWRPFPEQVPWGAYHFPPDVAYDVDPALVSEGQEHLLKPFYFTEDGWLSQFWARGAWGSPVEFDIDVPTPPDEPGDDGSDGGGPIPEPSTYAMLSGLGLLAFAAGRRLCHA